MKKRFIALVLVLVIGSMLISCGEDKNNLKEDNTILNENQVKKVSVTLSNITNKKMEEGIKNLLVNNGISEENVDTYIKYINDYNERVEDKSVLKEGFVTVDLINGFYDPVSLREKKLEDGRSLSEINCRLSAFELFKGFITTKGEIESDNYLMFDIDAIDSNPILAFNKEDKEKYINLFNPVDIGDTKEPEKIIELIKDELNKREVNIDNNGKVSLINIYINDEFENKMFVGHSVVMIESNGEYIVLEKFSSIDPFQISKFSTIEEVRKYLLSRNDIYGSEIKPIILINNEEF